MENSEEKDENCWKIVKVSKNAWKNGKKCPKLAIVSTESGGLRCNRRKMLKILEKPENQQKKARKESVATNEKSCEYSLLFFH